MKKYVFYKTIGLMDDLEKNEYLDGAKEHWQTIHSDEYHKITKEEFEDYLQFDNECWYDCTVDELKRVMKGNKYKIKAELGLWYGKRTATAEATGFETINKCLKDANDVVIYEERGTLKITTYHHDGVNNFIIKEITPKGLRSPHLYSKIYSLE